MRPTRNFRVAAWWGQPVSRFNRPAKSFIQPDIACLITPWSPMLPRNGNLESSD
ncbi:MAG: hypothetical protein ACT4QE_09550 [Anaerolineales bacterium]